MGYNDIKIGQQTFHILHSEFILKFIVHEVADRWRYSSIKRCTDV